MKSKLTIGKLAKAAGVGVETVRFYERKGLVQQPAKAGAFRLYGEDAATRIRFIRRAQELGFTLKETKGLVQLHQSKASCYAVRKKSEEKIAEIEAKIADLEQMKAALRRISSCCARGGKNLSSCPVQDCFDGECAR